MEGPEACAVDGRAPERGAEELGPGVCPTPDGPRETTTTFFTKKVPYAPTAVLLLK